MNIGLVSPRVLLRKSLCALFARVEGFRVVLDLDHSLDNTELLLRNPPDVLLVDFGSTIADGEVLSQLQTLVPQARILMLSQAIDDDDQIRAIRQGVRGFISETCDPQTLERALRLVVKGEIWASHRVLSRIINKFVRWHDADDGSAVQLTRREREILALIAGGCRNKEIANALSVSENTIRAHLVKLYRKIQVSDRLTAALYYFESAKKNGNGSSLRSERTHSSDRSDLAHAKPNRGERAVAGPKIS